jgi:hypothetical protein
MRCECEHEGKIGVCGLFFLKKKKKKKRAKRKKEEREEKAKASILRSQSCVLPMCLPIKVENE